MDNWAHKGLCEFGYYYDSKNSRVNCQSCEVVENIISSIDTMKEDEWVFRSLSQPEIKNLVGYNPNENRGQLKVINFNKSSLYKILESIFTAIKSTLNNKKDPSKLYSYSKSLVLPLFKYAKTPDSVIGIRKLDLNSVELGVDCSYFNWVKDLDGDHYSLDE